MTFPSVLNTLKNQSGEDGGGHRASAPHGIVGGRRLGSDDFVEGSPLFLERRHLVADSNYEVAVHGQFRSDFWISAAVRSSLCSKSSELKL